MNLIRQITSILALGSCFAFLVLLCAETGISQESDEFSISLEYEQLTSGTKHHFFGYIGQSLTIPWNANGRYVLGLEVDQIERMPGPDEFATIVAVDTHDSNKIIPLDKTRGWNPQQGTMLYWNPKDAESQFFFNDRDVESGKVFTVLYDIGNQRRVREFRFEDTPIGNGGVAPDGSSFVGLNYGRLARLRSVTGYPKAMDWSKDFLAPSNDGVFLVDVESGTKRLLVSFLRLEKELKKRKPNLDHTGLFINHTLWNRDSNQIYFFVRAGWSKNGGDKVNTPCSINIDGTELKLHDKFIGGHPEWAENNRLIGAEKRDGVKYQILYDVKAQKIVDQLGVENVFPDAEGDISLATNPDWFANGYKQDNKNYYIIYRRSDGAFVRSKGFDKGAFTGDIRIDPAPRWNRNSNAILVPGIASNRTRQMFVIRIKQEDAGSSKLQQHKEKKQSPSQLKSR